MKKVYLFNILFFVLFFTTACKTSKESNLQTNLKTMDSNCPDDGICSLEVIKNKFLQIKQDDIGALYPVLTEGKSNVLKFEYKRNEIANTQDGQYSEFIYAELPQNIKDIELNDKDLSIVKLLFGRLCFCRGQTGYYKVANGQLEIHKKDDGTFHFKLHFTIDEVPQIITLIETSFSLN
jgi:hypothetical protein